MFYKLLRNLLFCLDAEASHNLGLNLLNFAEKLKITKLFPKKINNPVNLLGLTFENKVGLAAGLDKNGDHIDALATLGFGFIEVGSITPRAQPGNPKPRIFRLKQHSAIINRLGFNNKGVDHLINNLKKIKFKGILGINIGKNFDTPLEKAKDDYIYVMKKVLQYASYITINISSPNTKGLRELQGTEYLSGLLKTLKKEQASFHKKENKYVPLLLKIAPDLTDDELKSMAEVFIKEKIDGIIATNTTISREGVDSAEVGGLSGKPLFQASTLIVEKLRKLLPDEIPIIACGGISSKEDAAQKLKAGASLVQVYTGLIYEGPGLIRSIVK